MTVFNMDRKQFLNELQKRTSPGEVFVNANNIYPFLSAIFGEACYDSLLRIWAFQWYTEETGDGYDNIYNKWLGKPYRKPISDNMSPYDKGQFVLAFAQLLYDEGGDTFFSSGDIEKDYALINETINSQGYWSGTSFRYYFDQNFKITHLEERRFGT